MQVCVSVSFELTERCIFAKPWHQKKKKKVISQFNKQSYVYRSIYMPIE